MPHFLSVPVLLVIGPLCVFMQMLVYLFTTRTSYLSNLYLLNLLLTTPTLHHYRQGQRKHYEISVD